MYRLALLSQPQNFCFSTSCSIDSDQPLVSSAADFHPPVAADAAARSRPDRQFFSSSVKSGLRNTHLSENLPDAGAGFGLFQYKRNLFFGITGLYHGNAPLSEMEERPETSV